MNPGLTAYIGTYTSGHGGGIHRLVIDPDSGEVRDIELVAETANPSFLALHPNGTHLYAVNELSEYEGRESGAVSAHRIEQGTGRLEWLNQVPSLGRLPAHLTVAGDGRIVLVANYDGPNIVACPLDGQGRLEPARILWEHRGSGPNLARQASAHPHSVDFDPSGRFVLVADLGTDQVVAYRVSADRNDPAPKPIQQIAVHPGSGPRHLVFHPSGHYVYLLCELSQEVVAFACDQTRGRLRLQQQIPSLPPGVAATGLAAEIAIDDAGRTLYCSNRGQDSIAVFAIAPGTGWLTPRQFLPSGGRTPRQFSLSPGGRWLVVANQDSNSLVIFRVDPASGELQAAGSTVAVPRPACVCFAAAAGRGG